MSTSLKISANTSEVKKSLLDLGKDVKNLGKTKVSIFSEEDRKFIKSELKQELSLMKAKMVENRAEISKMIKEQARLTKGSKEELEHRKKILSAYQQQTKLASQMDRVQKQQKSMGGIGGMGGSAGGGSGIAGILGKIGGFLGGAALGVGAMALMRGYQASQQYQAGTGNRIRLSGMGVEQPGVSDERLARAGLTEQELISRQVEGTSRLGRAGATTDSILQQAQFERSFGLEGGSMMNISGALRSSMGGAKADQTQAKIQAGIMAAGIDDALAPYLDSITDLLTDINKNGLSNTDEMMQLFAEMAKDGKRTPEQIAEAFKTIDSSVRGASGEANAFYQTAFARGGIGGGTIGSTRLAMSSGGISGLDENELAKRGYNPELLKNMKGAGFMSGTGERTGAILDQFKKSAGIGGKSIGDITDLNTMVGLSTMANATMGTEGLQGFDALKMMEQVQNKQMTQKQFQDKMEEMKAAKDPSVQRLDKINQTLAGQTDVLNKINTNLMENLGKTAVKVSNIATEADNALVQGAGNVAGAVDQTGAIDATRSGASSLRKNLTGGGLGEKLYDWIHGNDDAKLFKDAEMKFKKKGNIPTSPSAEAEGRAPEANDKALEDAVANGMTRAMQAQKAMQIQNNNKVNVRIQNGDGTVTNKTHR